MIVARMEQRCAHQPCKNSIVVETRGVELDLKAELKALAERAKWGDQGHCPFHDVYPWRR